MILAIDASLTGLAVAVASSGADEHRGEIMEFESVARLRKKKDPPFSALERIRRCDGLCDQVEALMNMCETGNATRAQKFCLWDVFIEGYSHGSKFSAHVLGELGGALRKRLLSHAGITSLTEVAPTQVKHFATGKGNAGKTAVATALCKRYGVEFDSDNKADAYGVLRIGMCVAGASEPRTDFERKVVDKVKTSWGATWGRCR